VATCQRLIDEDLTPAQMRSARRDLINRIEYHTGRPLIVYATAFLKHPDAQASLDDSDLEGFSDLVEDLPGTVLDVLLHCPGGSTESAERICRLLRSRFADIRYVVPHSAYSAATLLALSGNQILLDDRSALGPIVPQVLVMSGGVRRYVPSRAILEGFERARKILKQEGPDALPVFLPMLSKYELHIFETCRNAEKLSRALAREWLDRYMFGEDRDRAQSVNKIVKALSDHRMSLSDHRPLGIDQLIGLGLRIVDLRSKPELRQAFWELSCRVERFFDVASAAKFFENRETVSWSRFFQSQEPPETPIPIREKVQATPSPAPPAAEDELPPPLGQQDH
jgi:serine dehydrogenase proteinase